MRLGFSGLSDSVFKVAESLFAGVNGAQICIPEQADHTNEHEPEVRGYDREVDDLSGYVNGPITQ